MNKVTEFIVRFRNYLVTAFGSLMLFLPDLLASPELLAVIPPNYHKWVFLATLLVNLAIRWRPAVISTDLEASVSRSRRK